MTTNIYLALGDSLTAGYGVGRNNSFATLYYNVLRPHRPGLQYLNLGANGLTTQTLARMLSSNSRLRNLVTRAGLITITIGSNDLLALGKVLLAGGAPPMELALAQMAVNLNAIGAQLRSLNPPAKIQLATIYNPLWAGPYSHQSQTLVNQANALLSNNATTYGFVLVPTERVIQSRPSMTLGPDHFHPSLIGHQLMAAQFLNT